MTLDPAAVQHIYTLDRAFKSWRVNNRCVPPEERRLRLAMIGSGYVGLVSGACFSDFGHNVICVDRDESKVNTLRNGEIPIFEPGLDELVERNVRQGRLSFSTDLDDTLASIEAVFLAVGTPSRHGDGHADLSYVYQAAADVARAAKGPMVIVVKSTVPVGTGDEIERIMRAERPDVHFDVVSNPEFLREGAAISDFKHPDRVVIGVESENARQVLTEIYRPLSLNKVNMVVVNRRTSELIKYAANAFLAVKITFINEIANLCEATGANVQEVARGMGLDNRIGSKFLHAGPGYGGSCFPKDTLALVKTGQDFNARQTIVEGVVSINDARKIAMGQRIVKACGGSVRGQTVAILGLTFKPNTDDMREAPSLAILDLLIQAGAKIKAYDPVGMKASKVLMPEVFYAADPYSCIAEADAVALITEWDEFRALDLDRIRIMMRKPVMIDLRNIYNPSDAEKRGFSYTSIGRSRTN